MQLSLALTRTITTGLLALEQIHSLL